MRMVLSALIIIVISSFYHGVVGAFLSLSYDAEMRLYQFAIFLAACMGSYGVVLSAFGLILPAMQNDLRIRVMPLLILIVALVALFFYLLAATFDVPTEPIRDRLRPGETITI
ncbi:MAG: hypothetical protein M0T70_08515 [Geobacteraceae bacterium]|nr:hypothetical protein [Geobacteraceae bacterium]